MDKSKRYKKKTNAITKVDSFTKEQVLDAIKGSGAVVSTIARKLGVFRSTAERIIDMYEETKIAFQDEEKAMNDLAKTTILQSIKNGDVASAKWWSAKKNKAEGFGDEPMNVTVQNTVKSSNEDEIKHNLDKLSLEERDLYFELCEKMNSSTE